MLVSLSNREGGHGVGRAEVTALAPVKLVPVTTTEVPANQSSGSVP